MDNSSGKVIITFGWLVECKGRVWPGQEWQRKGLIVCGRSSGSLMLTVLAVDIPPPCFVAATWFWQKLFTAKSHIDNIVTESRGRISGTSAVVSNRTKQV